jgi:uncharacterized membrane protein YoaK (UPF0700 family)
MTDSAATTSDPVTRTGPRARPDRASLAAMVLSCAAGATDAFAFLLLGGVFTANMTGNLVLAGLVSYPDYPAMLTGIAVAFAAFVAGLGVALVATRRSRTPRRLASVLAAAFVAQALVLAGWVLLPDRASVGAQSLLLAFSALAMAAQTAVAKRLQSRSGVTTTYVTGTITSIMADLADGIPQALLTRIGVLVALVGGALCGGLLMRVDGALAAAFPLLPAAIGIVLIAVQGGPERRRASLRT